MRYLEDLEAGDTVTFEETYAVTREEILEVGKRWDPRPYHIDPEAARHSIFGGLVASSAHVFSIWVRIGQGEVDAERQIASVSALGFDKLQWHRPVRPDDVLGSSYTVISVRDSNSRPGLGVVTNGGRLFNQRDETVFTLEVTFLVPRKSEQQ